MRGPAERGGDAGHQFLHRGGLDQIVIGPDTERVDLVVLGAAGREHDDRDVVVLVAQLLDHPPPVGPRHHQIDDADVGTFEADLAQRAVAVRGPLHVVPGLG